MNNMIKVWSVRFQQCLGQCSMFSVEECSETGLFRHLYNHVFPSPQFPKYISYQGHLLLENVEKLMGILEMKEKNQKKMFVC